MSLPQVSKKTSWVQDFSTNLDLHMPCLVILRPLCRLSFTKRIILISKFWVYILEKSFVKIIFLEKTKRKKRYCKRVPVSVLSNRLAWSSTVLSRANLLMPTKKPFTNLLKLSLCDTTWVWINGALSNS